MVTKIIDGKSCQMRDVVFSHIEGNNSTEQISTKVISENIDGDMDTVYSWTGKDEFGNVITKQDMDNYCTLSSDTVYSGGEAEDRNYAQIQLSSRLIYLRRPIFMQLRELYRSHIMFYKSKKKSLKDSDLDLLIEDFRYDLHKIIAKARDEVIIKQKPLDTVLKINSLLTGEGNKSLQSTLRNLTLTFKRAQKHFETEGYLPKSQQIRLNESLNILVSSFILDVYGEPLNRRKMGVVINEDSKTKKKVNTQPSAGIVRK